MDKSGPAVDERVELEELTSNICERSLRDETMLPTVVRTAENRAGDLKSHDFAHMAWAFARVVLPDEAVCTTDQEGMAASTYSSHGSVRHHGM